VRLHHLTWGPPAGPPVVLLHGLRGHAWVWERAARHLAPPYRLLALEFRGHGDSDWSDEGYGTARHTADFEAWMDARGLGRVDLVGHSAGGRVAVAYAASHPARVRRLVVVDIGPSAFNRPLARRPVDPGAGPRTFPDVDAVVATLRKHHPLTSARYLRRMAARSVRRTPEGALAWKWDSRVRGQPPLAEPFRADLRALGCPTLVVRGATSAFLSPEGAAQMQALTPDCRVVTLARTGHTLHEERPASFARVVRGFLAEG
jgi:pimeloyl-ACP methyl ester carboxylesterase